jgi:hypothetical protein
MKRSSLGFVIVTMMVSTALGLAASFKQDTVSAAKNKVELSMNTSSFYPSSSGKVRVTGKTTPGAKIKLGLVGYKSSGKDGNFSLSTTSKKVDKKITVTAKLSGYATTKKTVTIKKIGSVSPSKKAEIKSINSALAADLKQDQGWAKGTLDSNGNPTDNGTPNAAFSWTAYIRSIKIDSDYQVTAQANASALTLTKENKKQLADHVGKFSLATLIRINKASDEQINKNSLFATVKVGKRVVSTHY